MPFLKAMVDIEIGVRSENLIWIAQKGKVGKTSRYLWCREVDKYTLPLHIHRLVKEEKTKSSSETHVSGSKDLNERWLN